LYENKVRAKKMGKKTNFNNNDFKKKPIQMKETTHNVDEYE
jgi:hypothetical protein